MLRWVVMNRFRSTILDTVRGIAVLPARVAVDLNEDDDMDQVPKNVRHESDVGWFFCDAIKRFRHAKNGR